METWSQALDFSAIAQKYGTPFYIFNPLILAKNVTILTTFVDAAKNIFYPIKANSFMPVLKELAKLGTSFDCASEYEIKLVQNCGAPFQALIYNSPAPDIDLMRFLLEQGSNVVVDSLSIFERLTESLHLPFKGHIFLRVNPALKAPYKQEKSYQQLLAHASAHSKFGMPPSIVLQICQNTSIPISGLHVHVGSRMDNIDAFVKLIDYMHHLIDKIHQTTSQKIRFLNSGGGLGINLTSQDHYPSLEEYAQTLTRLKRPDLEYLIEPGNALVGKSMGLLVKVRELKKGTDKSWALIDVSADQLINLIALKTPHQILTQNKTPLPHFGRDSIAGPLCFAGDIVYPETNLEDVKQGDVLFIQHCGSYCYTLSNHFNGQLFSGMGVVEESGNVTLAHSPENPYLTTDYTTYVSPIHSTRDASPLSSYEQEKIVHFLDSFFQATEGFKLQPDWIVHTVVLQKQYEIPSPLQMEKVLSTLKNGDDLYIRFTGLANQFKGLIIFRKKRYAD